MEVNEIVDGIRKWMTLAAFCAAAVGFYLNLGKLNSIESATKQLQEFQYNQDKLNERRNIVDAYVFKTIMGIEIPEEDEEDPL